MHRFHLPPAQCRPPLLELPGREAHHARDVLRMKPGEPAAVLDGAGRQFLCEVRDCDRHRVTLAVTDFVGSATLVAVTVTVWELAIEAGAVYRPAAVMLPTSGLSDQVTAVLPVLVTVAEKLWV